MFDNVPFEMRAVPQWIVWRAEQRGNSLTKVPLNPSNGWPANVSDPSTWCAFDVARNAVAANSTLASGIGFCFGGEGNFVGIDIDKCFNPDGTLDARAQNIVERFNSYTEISPSGNGLHIIIKANVPPEGRRREGVEMYSRGRYFTVTGNVYLQQPVCEHDWMARVLYDELAGSQANTTDFAAIYGAEEQTAPDTMIFDAAASASNGDKFVALYEGHWRDLYQSQSEADFALVDIIAYFSNNAKQVERMFLASALGQRDKAHRKDYVAGMVRRAYDNRVPMVPLALAAPAPVPTVPPESLATPIKAAFGTIEPEPAPVPALASAIDASDPYTPPPGLVGDIAKFIHDAAPYPMRQAAIAAALALMAGICGRQFQCEHTGLNLYLMLLARTGAGKEQMADGISKLLRAVTEPTQTEGAGVALPFKAAEGFRGPAELTGKGVLNTFMKSGTLSFVSILQEFAYKMKQLADPRNSNAGDILLKKLLLDLYMKSTAGNDYAGTTTADKDKDVPVLRSPAFSVLCESTPDRLYSALDEQLIRDGLLPRFTIFECMDVVDFNEQSVFVHPSADLTTRLRELCRQVITAKVEGDTRFEVAFDDAGRAMSRDFRIFARKFLKPDDASEVTAELWNRAHLKAVRIAALVAIGVSRTRPIITAPIFEWAKAIVVHEVSFLLGKFERGEVGEANNDETDQLRMVQRVVREFFEETTEQLRNMKGYAKFANAHEWGCIPYSYLMLRTQVAVFKRDRRGHVGALKAALDVMVRTAELERVPPMMNGQKTEDVIKFAGEVYRKGRGLDG